jgi:cell division protein FtsL
MRILNLCVVVLLVLAASYVYEIKFESTLRAERVAKMRSDLRHERDAIAALRAEWATLDNPARIQGLARRHLRLRPADATQFDQLRRLPERPPVIVQPPPADLIANQINNNESVLPTTSLLDANPITGSVPVQADAR